jgi:hypothetical protein
LDSSSRADEGLAIGLFLMFVFSSGAAGPARGGAAAPLAVLQVVMVILLVIGEVVAWTFVVNLSVVGALLVSAFSLGRWFVQPSYCP